MSVVVSLLLTEGSLVRSRAPLHIEVLALRHQLHVVPTRNSIGAVKIVPVRFQGRPSAPQNVECGIRHGQRLMRVLGQDDTPPNSRAA
jgi:hypothetical protein